MPGLEDWLNNPLDIIQNLFDKNQKDYSQQAVEYFKSKLSNGKATSWVPSLNDVPLHQLRADTLVRFRCMIQDMYDPEFYLGVYEVADQTSGETRLKSGKYRDIASCGPQQELRLDSGRCVTLDRQTLYCVPVPGEADWVKAAYSESSRTKKCASTPQTNERSKRGREVETAESAPSPGATEQPAASTSHPMETGLTGTAETKRTRTEEQTGTGVSRVTDLNFPLKDEKGPACIVKIYDGLDGFKVNDVVEFIGVLSVDPALASFESSDESGIVDVPMTSEEERNAHAPPPSLVPRLHAILAHRLTNNNPLMGDNQEEKSAVADELKTSLSAIRTQLLSVLQHALLGDALAAEYMLCHLISSVFARADVMPLGKLSLNLSGCPKGKPVFPQLFYHLLSNLVTKSHKLPMTLSTMNACKFSPEKDYAANRLRSGVLQLSGDTHLVLDETALEAGQLDATGVQNVTALGNLITWQKVEYDFCYHKQDFTTSVPVLTLSEGKSLLPSDCHVPLSAQTDPDDLRGYYTQLDSVLTPENLRKLRVYITLTKYTDYNMGEGIQKKIQDDFVEIRKDNPKSMTVDDFHALLNLVRLLSLSFGLNTANMEMWNKAKAMEVMRKQRVSQIPAGSQTQRAN